MIEVRRDLYMDEQTGKKSTNFNEIRRLLQNIITKTCEYINEH